MKTRPYPQKPIDPFERVVAGLALGSEEFAKRLVHLLRIDPAARKDEPSTRRLLRTDKRKPDPEEIEQAIGEVFQNEYPMRRARMLLYAQRRYSHLGVGEIAERYERSLSAVSMAVKAIESETRRDSSLAANIKSLERRLESKNEK